MLQDGSTPLYTASCYGYMDTMKLLLKAGADVNVSNKVSLGVHDLLVLSSHLAKIKQARLHGIKMRAVGWTDPPSCIQPKPT